MALLASSCAWGDGTNSADADTLEPGTVEIANELDPHDVIAGRPYEVLRSQLDLTDASRDTPAGSETPEAPGRHLPTELWIPDGTGPFPLIMFGHGRGDDPAFYRNGLFNHWASAGYAVAAPRFPLTNIFVEGAPLNTGDAVNQDEDVRFVLDEILTRQASGDEFLGRIDTDRIGVAGLSLGGATAYNAGINTCCRDERFGAVMVLSGVALPGGGDEPFEATPDIPVLVLHGTDDEVFPFAWAIGSLALLDEPRVLVALQGADHGSAAWDYDSAWDGIVTHTTTAFWDRYLLGDTSALERIDDPDVIGWLAQVVVHES